MAQGRPVDNSYSRKIGLRMIEKVYTDKVAPKNVLMTLYETIDLLPEEIRKNLIRCLGKIGEDSTISFLSDKVAKKEASIKEDVDSAIDNIKKKLK